MKTSMGPITEQTDRRSARRQDAQARSAEQPHSSEPEGGATTLTDAALYDGSMIGKYKLQAPPPPAATLNPRSREPT